MTAHIRGRLYGRTFQVDLPEAMVEAVLPRLPHGWELSDAEPECCWTVIDHGDHFYDVVQQDVVVKHRTPWGALAGDLGGSVELWIAEHAEDLIVIHAGAIEWEGRIVAIPGHTLSGKSVLVREFLRRGAGYFSDEYIPLRPDGLAIPYPRPISVRPNGNGLSHQVPVETFGCPVGDAPLPLGLVVDVRFAPDAGLALTTLSTAEAAISLLRHCVPAQTRPGDSLGFVHAAVRECRGFSGTRGEAAEAVDLILDLMR